MFCNFADSDASPFVECVDSAISLDHGLELEALIGVNFDSNWGWGIPGHKALRRWGLSGCTTGGVSARTLLRRCFWLCRRFFLVAPNVPQAEKGKSVSLQIMGNYFETQETQKQIMEMIRKESDATDFKYAQIGVR